MKTALLHSGAAIAVIVLVLLPWGLPATMGRWASPVLMSTNGGINLYIGNGPGADGGYRYRSHSRFHMAQTFL